MLLEVSWTDKVQAVSAAIAIPGSIWALILLLKRDRARESEIHSLSQIAKQLTNMLKVSESRHKDSKKPQMTIELKEFSPFKILKCEFVNSNTYTSIIDYEAEANGVKEIVVGKTFVTNNNGKQSFSLDLNYLDDKPEWIDLVMKYKTDEGYIFSQEILIWHFHKKEYKIVPREIAYKGV